MNLVWNNTLNQILFGNEQIMYINLLFFFVSNIINIKDCLNLTTKKSSK